MSKADELPDIAEQLLILHQEAEDLPERARPWAHRMVQVVAQLYGLERCELLVERLARERKRKGAA